MPKTSTLSMQCIDAIQSVIGSGSAVLHEPQFKGNEWNYVKQCLDTGWVSTAGTFVDRFESDLSTFSGARHAVAMINGTCALHIALQNQNKFDNFLEKLVSIETRLASQRPSKMLSTSEARSIAAQFKNYHTKLSLEENARYDRVYGAYLSRNGIQARRGNVKRSRDQM